MDRQSWIRDKVVGSILDVGCGHSRYFWVDGEHIEEHREYLGLDIFKEPSWDGPGRPDTYIQADAENIPIQDNSFDTAVVGEVIEHTENPIQLIRGACRGASQRVLVTVTDESSWADELDFSDMEYGHPKQQYDAQKLLKYCVSAGFSEEDVTIEHTVDFPIAFWLAECKV